MIFVTPSQTKSMRTGFVIMIILSSFLSCKTANKIFTSNKTPHELYSSHLTDAKLNTTALGTSWLNAAQKALNQPILIQLPYKETGYFAAEQPFAFGYRFNVKRGEKVNISIITDSTKPILLFADLWHYDTIKPRLIKAADTTSLNIIQEVDENEMYSLRIQPELLRSGQFTVTISATGSLAFPVPAENNPRIGSFWGAARDAGARKHEGIDIFGKFRTPVVAAADGYITSTKENNLGGKVVFLRPYQKNYTLYYAHLDSPTVREGQDVKAGDVVGLMGNTGNARTTPTHLHFGIYTNGGAIDPLPFVDKENEKPQNISASLEPLGNFVRTNKAWNVFASASAKSATVDKLANGSAVQVIAATSDWYHVVLPNGKEGFINNVNIVSLQSPLRTITTISDIQLLEKASLLSSAKELIRNGTSLPVYGTYENFYLVKTDNLTGWIRKP